ncbi:MAG TPA: TVP38/TMEM64 family protein [Desulfitobacterium dehalogenans]|uniref:TVP38/TMEM64 family membrane protein n=1 Tax=Desulfitobacterium dehalogenans TaxID=36854 RepID=A0A7C7D9Y6_9FIRM|nr:TVP38/TMEM64 family protein [Desulfitobacterium dehalogenans]
MKQKLNRKSSFLITLLLSVLVIGPLLYWSWPYLTLLSDPDQVREIIIRSGTWGPLVFIFLQIVQILIAPIPGQVIGVIGGFLFGPFLGLLYTMLGATIGFTLVFILARKLGRPFVERFVDRKNIERFDHLSEEKGAWVFFFIFLLPAFPDDLIAFIAGLTTIPIRTLVLISVAGRLPGYAVLAFMGNGLALENLNPVVVTIAALIIIFVLAWWKRGWLRKFVEHKNRSQFISEQWNLHWQKIILWTIVLVIIFVIFFYAATVTPIQR